MIPTIEVDSLRARVAELEAENARLAAEVARALPRATKGAKSRLRGTSEAETASPWEASEGFAPRYRAAHPDVARMEDAFLAFPVLSEGTPAYQAARRAYVGALYGTTVEARIRKMSGAYVRQVGGGRC